MTDTEIRVRDLIEAVLVRESSSVPGSAKLVDDLGVTSLHRFERIMALELEFQLVIPDGALEAIVTVDDIVRYIDSRILSQT